MSPDDSDQTLPVGGPSPSGLVRDNAGHILGRMLGDQPAGMEQEGDTIGPYRLLEMLGEGGFGIVWQAEQTEPVRREVALKVIKSGMDTMQVLNRFNQERQALASLDHPGIATLLNAGVTGDGRPYFAMELVRGGPVTSWCATNSATLQLRLRLFIQVCQAVQHAHEKGILHRDLKPSNILVTEVDGEPVPKVIDFGIAKAITAASSLRNPTMLTQADQVLGTPLYMSPEQVNGTKELDARTDVYALGVLLYELLTGALPLDLTVFRSGDLLAMKRHILETLPERPSTRVRRRQTRGGQDSRSPNALPPSLPADLDWITLRAMEKSRELRYASALELAEDVQRHLSHQRVRARPPSFAAAASRWIRRHRGGFIAAAAGSVLSGIVAGGALLWKSMTAADSVAKLAALGSFTNSLGMKFVPVPVTGGPTSGQPVLFSIWEMRVQDYDVFAKETKRAWPLPEFKQGPTHPAVNVSWEDVTAFCAWLTEREQKAGKLAPGDAYRLPSDHEWSCAVGIGEREDPKSPPHLKNEKIPLEFPWGAKLPAPNDAGNYRSDELRTLKEAGMARQLDSNFDGRLDGFGATAPVASYAPNRFGLYDLGGNAWEWCEEWFDMAQTNRVVRGGCWSTTLTHHLLSSCRNKNAPTVRGPYYGVRVVLASVSLPAVSKLSSAALPMAGKHADATQDAPFENTLGMKFVPVPGTDVLFCIHETRFQDFSAYAAAVPGTDSSWRSNALPGYGVPLKERTDHPVTHVNWEESDAFCRWLSHKEGKTYRLPTDQEWSIAAGIGGDETWTEGTTPKTVATDSKAYPWGSTWPPLEGAGNYCDEAWKRAHPSEPRRWLTGYDDGFAFTAPVMRFKPNPFGLFDMGGNVAEWVWDWADEAKKERVLRGGFWSDDAGENLQSSILASHRILRDYNPGIKNRNYGFRCVLETKIPATRPEFVPPTALTLSSPEPAEMSKRLPLARFPAPLAPEEVSKRGLTNSLGMKFVPVPGTAILFCIHETRRQDYAAFASEVPDPGPGTAWRTAKFLDVPTGAGADHPVCAVSWDQAGRFCEWLSRKEGRRYRLPTDHEWSIAVGLGKVERDDPKVTPQMKNNAGRVELPYGGQWPPQSPARVGNYGDLAVHRQWPDRIYIPGYEDGYATSAPVMSYPPNPFGLYDMGGNVWEWVADWFDENHDRRIIRGGSWADVHEAIFFSARRFPTPSNVEQNNLGFRVVLAPDL